MNSGIIAILSTCLGGIIGVIGSYVSARVGSENKKKEEQIKKKDELIKQKNEAINRLANEVKKYIKLEHHYAKMLKAAGKGNMNKIQFDSKQMLFGDGNLKLIEENQVDGLLKQNGLIL